MTASRTEQLYRIGWLFAVALSIAAYLGVWSGRLVWDDADLVWDPNVPGGGSAVGGGDTFLHCFTRPFLWNYYRPLVSASFFLEHQLFGRAPLGYHVSNTLMHALATAVLVPMLLRAFGSRSVAVTGGVFYAIHPVHVSAVGWIGGRTDALACLWAVLFGYTLIRGVQSEGDARVGWIASSVVFYTLSLFTKEQMLALLPLVPLAFACFGPADRRDRRSAGWLALAPFALAALLFVCIGLFLGMPRVPPPRADRLTQMEMAGWTWVHYTRLLLLPAKPLLQTFSLGGYERTGWPVAALGWSLAAGTVGLFVWWMRSHRASAWFLAWVVLSLLPVSNLTPMWFLLLGPYRAAISSVGVCALLGRLGAPGVFGSVRAAALARVAAVALAAWYLGLTLWGLGAWRSDTDLFTAIVRDDPDSVLGRYMLARLLIDRDEADQAAPHVEHMLQWLYRSDAWRRPDAAVRAALTDRALRQRVLQHQGGVNDPRIFLGIVFTQLACGKTSAGDLAGARLCYDIAERLNPGTGDVAVGLGYLAYRERNYPEAEKQFRAALRAKPPRPDALGRLAQTYEAEGRPAEARAVREGRW